MTTETSRTTRRTLLYRLVSTLLLALATGAYLFVRASRPPAPVPKADHSGVTLPSGFQAAVRSAAKATPPTGEVRWMRAYGVGKADPAPAVTVVMGTVSCSSHPLYRQALISPQSSF